MMTAKPLASAQDAKHYYEKDNYYTKDEGINDSLWLGEGGKQLGLEGKVDPDVFFDLLKGKIGEYQLGRKTRDGIEHRPGIDCTFNAPKSISILSEVLGEKAIREAHLEAVKVAVEYLERNAAQARITKEGKTRFVKTGNLTVAAFTHDTSRELDPHLHTHCVVLNGTRTGNGWRALSNELILKMQKTAGAIYRNELAYRVKQLGFSIRQTDKEMFELTCFNDEELNKFSTRRKQILEYIEKNNLSYSPANAQVATLATRQAKREVERESLRALWREKAAALGLSVRRGSRDTEGEREPGLRRALRYAIHHLSEKDMAFSEKDIIERLISYDVGLSGLKKIRNEINRFRREGLLLEADGGKLTTPYGERLEKEVLGYLHKGFHTKKPFLTEKKIEKILAPMGLDENQRQAVLKFSLSRDRYFGIRGVAGSGKTTTLAAVKRMLDKSGCQIIAMAPTHTAAEKMADALNLDACTLDYFLTTKGQGVKLPKKKKGKEQVWVVDETTFSSTKRIRKLMRLAERENARVLFLGDHRQLESIEAGRAFKQMQDAGMDCVSLKKIYRQKTDELLKAVEHIYERDVDRSLMMLKNEILEKSDPDARHKLVSEDWLALNDRERRDAAIIVATNAERKAINQHVRSGLVRQGVLSREAREYISFTNRYLSSVETRMVGFYRIGDVVRFNVGRKLSKNKQIRENEYFDVVGINREKNELSLRSRENGREFAINPNRVGGNKVGGIEVFSEEKIELRRGDRIKWTDSRNSLGLRRNDKLTVQFINKSGITLQDDKGRQYKVAARKLSHLHFSHHYATTIYGAQGEGYSQVFIVLDSKRVNTVTQSSYLVAISRAKEKARLYVDNLVKIKRALGERLGENTTALKQEKVNSLRASMGKVPLL